MMTIVNTVMLDMKVVKKVDPKSSRHKKKISSFVSV